MSEMIFEQNVMVKITEPLLCTLFFNFLLNIVYLILFRKFQNALCVNVHADGSAVACMYMWVCVYVYECECLYDTTFYAGVYFIFN